MNLKSLIKIFTASQKSVQQKQLKENNNKEVASRTKSQSTMSKDQQPSAATTSKDKFLTKLYKETPESAFQAQNTATQVRIFLFSFF